MRSALNTRMADESLAKTFVGLENVQQGYETAKALFEKMGNHQRRAPRPAGAARRFG